MWRTRCQLGALYWNKGKDLGNRFLNRILPNETKYHNRGNFLGQTNRRNIGRGLRRLIERENKCKLSASSAEGLQITKVMTSITDKKPCGTK